MQDPIFQAKSFKSHTSSLVSLCTIFLSLISFFHFYPFVFYSSLFYSIQFYFTLSIEIFTVFTLLCLSAFSKLFHVQTGNNQAFTGSSHVEWGPYPQYTCQRLFYGVGDKNKPIHTHSIDSQLHGGVENGQ